MWDNPRLLNLAANLLFGFAATLFAFSALQLLLRSPLFPLREIVVRGELKHANREEIANAMDGMGGNFFAADLGGVRGRLEQVVWVRRVDARRVWPDRIEVRLEEHVPFARWGDSGLVNSYGEPFAAALEAGTAGALPLFAGPVGTEGEVSRRYRRFTELLAPLGAVLERIVLTPRHAWQLRLARRSVKGADQGADQGADKGADSDLELELGRDGAEPVEQRLARFVAAYPDSIGRLPRGAGVADGRRHVDLRYPNGFALRVAGWKG